MANNRSELITFKRYVDSIQLKRLTRFHRIIGRYWLHSRWSGLLELFFLFDSILFKLWVTRFSLFILHSKRNDLFSHQFQHVHDCLEKELRFHWLEGIFRFVVATHGTLRCCWSSKSQMRRKSKRLGIAWGAIVEYWIYKSKKERAITEKST